MARDLVFTILGIDRASPAFKAVAKAADDTHKKLEGVGRVSTLALGGTAAAAAAAGAGIAAALGGTALAFGALGIAAAASNVEVRDSFQDLWASIETGTRDAAAPLVPVLKDISGQLGQTFDEIQPRLEGLFTGSIPAIHAVVDGVTGFAREAMPGLEVAVRNSEAPMEALRDLMIDTGRGTTEFFTELSAGSESSGRIIRAFGDIVEAALGGAGELLATLANTGAPSVERLAQVFAQLMGVVNQLSTGAFPVMFGAIEGGLDVLSGLLAIVSGLSPVLGPLVGLVTAFGGALKLIDLVSFGRVSAEFGALKAGIAQADGVAGKFRAGLHGLVFGLGPLGLAAGIAAVVLGQLGNSQQRAAEKASDHRARVDSLSAALRESGGAITENVRALAAKELQSVHVIDRERDLLGMARGLGVSLPQLTDAYLGNSAAQQGIVAQLDAMIPRGAEALRIQQEGTEAERRRVGVATLLRQALTDTNGEFGAAVQANKDLAAASQEAADATGQHTSALVRLQEQLLGYVDKNLGYRMAVHAEREAHEKATEAIRNKGVKSDEATAATFAWEQAVLRSVTAAGAQAEANNRGSNATELARLRMEAQNREIVRLAELSGNAAPLALRQMVGGMDRAALAALGATVRIDGAGNAVYRLPNGKEIFINAHDRATPVAENIIRRFDGRSINMHVNLGVREQRDLGMITGSIGGRAMGGPVAAGRPYIVGEKGPELIFPAQDGFVATASQTKQMMSGARTDSVRNVLGGSGGAERHYHLTVYNAANSEVDLRTQFERMELMAGA